MDYQQYLSKPLSLLYVDHLVNEIFENPDDFDKVYQLIFTIEEKVKWRAAWACQKISEKHPEWFDDSHFNQIKEVVLSTSNEGLLRGCVGIINNLPLPDPLPVDLLNVCYTFISNQKYSIAVQAISIKIIYKFCKLEPELKTEFKYFLENIDVSCLSSGLKSVRNNMLKLLNK